MKAITSILFLFFLLNIIYSQAPQFEGRVYLDRSSKTEMFEQVSVAAYLVNISNKALTVSSNALPNHNIEEFTWFLKLDGQNIEITKFRDRLTQKYKKDYNKTLQPGDSMLLERHLRTIDKPGIYEFSFVCSQNKSNFNPNYVKPEDIKENTDFKVSSGVLKISITIPDFASEIIPIDYEKLKGLPMLTLGEALKNPNEAYKLRLSKLEKKHLPYFEYLKNIRVLEINDIAYDLDSLPDVWANLHLSGLSIETSGGGKKMLTFPKNMCSSNTLVQLYFAGIHVAGIPDWVYDQKELKTIELRNVGLQNISQKIENLENLEEFILWERNPQEAKLQELPANFSKLASLKKLSLEQTKLEDFSVLQGLTGLTFLKLINEPKFKEDNLVLRKINSNGAKVIFNVEGRLVILDVK